MGLKVKRQGKIGSYLHKFLNFDLIR